MNVLITGGGFLGARLALHLQAAGHGVRVLDVAPPGPAVQRLLATSPPDWRIGDVAEPTDVQRALQGCDSVVHLAALLTPACAADPVRGLQVNALGTLHVFEAARAAGLRHVVYASSGAVYGPHSAAQPAPSTLYGTWKLAAEGMARACHQDHGIGSVGLRPFIVYGAGREVGGSSGPSIACRAAVRGQPYTIPFTGRCGLVYVDDVVEAFAAALTPRRPGAHVFNLVGEEADVEQVIAEIRRHVPGARLAAEGPPLPLAPGVLADDTAAVLGPVRHTPLAAGIAATIAACRAEPAAVS